MDPAGGWQAALPLLAMLAVAGTFAPGPLPAQESPTPPETVAEEYLRGIEATAWRATAQRIHPEALAEIRERMRILVESDTTSRALDRLSGGQTLEEFFSLNDGSLFVAAMRTLERESPGIINAMSDRDSEVVGPVAEGDSLQHVVYRQQWRLSGSNPEIEVMTLALDEQGRWRVVRASELDSVPVALRTLVLPRSP